MTTFLEKEQPLMLKRGRFSTSWNGEYVTSKMMSSSKMTLLKETGKMTAFANLMSARFEKFDHAGKRLLSNKNTLHNI